MAAMGRVIHVRVHGLDPADRESLRERFEDLADTRDWRGDRPWLADAASSDLFESLFFEDAARAAGG